MEPWFHKDGSKGKLGFPLFNFEYYIIYCKVIDFNQSNSIPCATSSRTAITHRTKSFTRQRLDVSNLVFKEVTRNALKEAILHSATFITASNKRAPHTIRPSFNSFRKAFNACNYQEHAEMAAIRNLMKSAPNRTVYHLLVTRITHKGIRKNSRPCSKCVKHIMRAIEKGYNIRTVTYSNEHGMLVRVRVEEL